jgi:hypothetical protein
MLPVKKLARNETNEGIPQTTDTRVRLLFCIPTGSAGGRHFPIHSISRFVCRPLIERVTDYDHCELVLFWTLAKKHINQNHVNFIIMHRSPSITVCISFVSF